jgi:uncharacterized protein
MPYGASRESPPIIEDTPQSQTLTIIMAGPAGSGKTAFIKAVDDDVEAMPYMARRRHERWLQTATPKEIEDYRQRRQGYAAVPVNEHTMLQIFAAPPAIHERHLLYWEIMSGSADGYIFLIDSTRTDTFDEARYTIETLRSYVSIPCIIAANRHDSPGALTIGAIRNKLDPGTEIPIRLCAASERESAQSVLMALFDAIVTSQA